GAERESLNEAGKSAVEPRVAALDTEIVGLAEREKTADPRAVRELASRRGRLESVARLLKGGPAHVTVPKQPEAWRILARGDYRQPGDVVSPRGLACVAGAPPEG